MFRYRSHVSACVFRYRSYAGRGADAAVSLPLATGPSQGPLRVPTCSAIDHMWDPAHAIPATDLACGSPLEEGTPAYPTETDPTPPMHAVRGVFLRSVRSAAGPGGPVVSEAGAFLKKLITALSRRVACGVRAAGALARVSIVSGGAAVWSNW